MATYKVLIICNNPTFRAELERCFSSSEHFELLPSASSGAEALNTFAATPPDIALLEMIMPGMDGIEVLNRLKERQLGQNCMIFALTLFYMNPLIINLIQELGVMYLFAQPLSAELVFNRVLDFAGNKTNTFALTHEQHLKIEDTPTYEAEVTNYLRALGVPAHMDGYRYLKEAVLYALDVVPRTPNVTTELYPTLAVRHDKRWNSIERCIRNAIEVAWQRGDIDIQHSIFGYTVNSNKGKPTNKEFIAMLTEKIVMRIQHAHA